MPARRMGIPDDVWNDPKTGKEPKTKEERNAQSIRIARWVERQAAEEAVKKFEEGNK